MDILSYLLELLQQSKEVGITGLGTFYKKKFPGRYDKEKQSFLPPAYALQFTKELKEENALATFISSKRNISVESAQYYIDQFVVETNEKLELAHEANFENLGRLFYTEHEGLTFEAEKNINYGSEFFGLPSLAEADTKIQKTADLPISSLTEDDVYEEIAEAPAANENHNPTEIVPQIENVELDEVNDDLKNTLKHSEKSAENEIEVPESIKEQHEEHPDRFGHKPESEEDHLQATSPEPIEEHVEEIPVSEVEVPKTYINLHEELPKEEIVHEAPAFIKEQHAEHPNRFGHDPINPEYAKQRMATWLKVLIAVIILIIIVGVTYYIKPDLFGQSKTVETQPAATIDTNKVVIDSAKFKRDSIAKTDSILKANQVNAAKTVKTDTTKKAKTPVSAVAPIPNAGPVTFEVIGTSVKTTKRAEQFVQSMKKHGIAAKIITGMPGKLIKVSLGSFKTEAEAKAQKQILAEKTNIIGLYIQQINNTQ
ncbi:SPOR domain-containing protein [Pedobacter nototheniae]|uniref:HU domain-containing protein n=1 Tax=Pedobacter nototheniae TaxID=2488994 RepID=UPI00292EBDD7|nr:SPOR domain-containing protein [Pedobacter nototheniae]